LSFLFPENTSYTGEWHILPIGLLPVSIRDTITPYYYIDRKEINPLLKIRTNSIIKVNLAMAS